MPAGDCSKRKARMPLGITTRMNHFDSAKKPYCFRNIYSGTVESDELIRRIAENNTTLTEADTLACLNVMEEVITELIADGKKVRTPFGLFYLAASGTAEEVDEPFTPLNAESGHSVNLHFCADRDFTDHAVALAVITREEWKDVEVPVIYTVSDGSGTEAPSYTPGGIIKIKGRRLSYNEEKPDEGVFFTDTNGSAVRAQQIFHNKPTLLIVQIPEELTSGMCTVQVMARIGGSKDARSDRGNISIKISA